VDSGSIKKIIGKFLQGNCSDEEFAYLLYWYESFDENPVITLSDKDKVELKAKILKRIQQNIPELQQQSREVSVCRTHRTSRVANWWKYGIAAAVIGLLLWSGLQIHKSISGSSADNAQQSASESLITLNNKSGRMHFVVLPDSSKVWLSPNSSLAYPEKLMGRQRRVRLEGEAFFDIYKSPSRPFILSSGGMITRVLGTSFLVKAFKDMPVEIAVVTGKVAVSRKSGKQQEMLLSLGQKAVLGSDGKLLRKTHADKAVLRRWQKVNLSFDNITLARVIEALDKKFAVRIYCQRPDMYQYRLNADFNNQHLMDILEMLERSLNIQYEMASDSVINFYADKNSL
jgi:ferric-dicitrate binding protein FerR (iron transport regulator)